MLKSASECRHSFVRELSRGTAQFGCHESFKQEWLSSDLLAVNAGSVPRWNSAKYLFYAEDTRIVVRRLSGPKGPILFSSEGRGSAVRTASSRRSSHGVRGNVFTS